MFNLMVSAEEESKPISAVEIQGNKNVSNSTIREKIKLRKGDVVSDESIKEDVQNILSLDSVEEVIPSVEETADGKLKLIFKVTEKPFIKKIEFKGNKQFSNGKLKGELTFKEKESYYDISKAEEDCNKIVIFYKDKGYADCKVEQSQVYDEKLKGAKLTFFVTEGKKITIKKVEVAGTKEIKPKTILGLMKTKKNKPYKEEFIVADKEAIISYYKNHGYLRMELEEPQISYNDERTEMNIVFNIKEGIKFTIGIFSFSGNSVLKEKELIKVLEMKPGKMFEQEKYDISLMNLRAAYSDKGYLNADIVPEIVEDEANKKVNIEFKINEKTPVYVKRFYVEGNTYTKSYVLEREILLKSGDILYANKVRRSLERLYNLGFLEDVRVDVQPTDEPDKVDVVFFVSEGKPGMLSAGMGYSSTDKLVGTLQVQHMNLLGRAYRLNLLWEFGERKQNYEISFNEPWLLGKPISLGVNLFNTDRVRQYTTVDYGTDLNAYSERRQGVGLSLGPRISEYYSLSFGYSYEKVDLLSIDPQYVDLIKPIPIVSSLTGAIIHDNRDNIFDASRGSRDSFSLQLSGGVLGGDAHFYKPYISTSWYFPLIWKLVFSASGKMSMVGEFSNTKVYNEYFYLGGADSVRGYNYGEISPPGGGKIMMVYNAEIKFPLVMEHGRTSLQGAAFLDIGGAWENLSDINLNIGDQPTWMKAGVGLGIRLTTPVFPLRFDWGYRLDGGKSDPLQFYFNIGNIF